MKKRTKTTSKKSNVHVKQTKEAEEAKQTKLPVADVLLPFFGQIERKKAPKMTFCSSEVFPDEFAEPAEADDNDDQEANEERNEEDIENGVGRSREDNNVKRLNITPEMIMEEQDIKKRLLTHISDGPPGLSDERAAAITGSEVSSICNQNPYPNEDPKNRFRQKALRIKIQENEAMKHGKMYEPVALNILKTQIVDGSPVVMLFNIHFLTHARYTWLGGTLDGIVVLEDGRVVVVEVKCPKSRKIIHGEVPEVYKPQIQTYLFITGLHQCAFVQYKPRGKRGSPEIFDITMVDVDVEYMRIRMPMLRAFYSHLELWNQTCYRWLTAWVLMHAHESTRRFRPKGPAWMQKLMAPDPIKEAEEAKRLEKEKEAEEILSELRANLRMRRGMIHFLILFSAGRRKQLIRKLTAEETQEKLDDYGLSPALKKTNVLCKKSSYMPYSQITRIRNAREGLIWIAHKRYGQEGFFLFEQIGPTMGAIHEVCIVQTDKEEKKNFLRKRPKVEHVCIVQFEPQGNLMGAAPPPSKKRRKTSDKDPGVFYCGVQFEKTNAWKNKFPEFNENECYVHVTRKGYKKNVFSF